MLLFVCSVYRGTCYLQMAARGVVGQTSRKIQLCVFIRGPLQLLAHLRPLACYLTGPLSWKSRDLKLAAKLLHIGQVTTEFERLTPVFTTDSL